MRESHQSSANQTTSKLMLTDGVHPLMVSQMGHYSPTSTLCLRPEVFHPVKQLDRVVTTKPLVSQTVTTVCPNRNYAPINNVACLYKDVYIAGPISVRVDDARHFKNHL